MSDSSILSSDVMRNFRSFYFGDLPPMEFDNWLCHTPNLEEFLGGELFLDLVYIDYSKRDEVETAKQAVREAYGENFHGDILRDRVRDTLEAMLSKEISLRAGCVILWELRLDGALFIPAVFAGYASELEESGDDSFYRDRIVRDVREFLCDFED